MIRVLHVIPSLALGGAETMLLNLLRQSAGMLASGDLLDVRVACIDQPGPRAGEAEAMGIPVHDAGSTAGVAGSIAKLRRIVQTHQPDVVQTWMYRADLLGLAAALSAGPPRAGVVWNIRCGVGWERRGWARRGVFNLLRTLSPLPDVVVSNSRGAIEGHTQAGFRPRRWELLPNGFDTSKYRPRPEARAALRAELGVDPGTPLVGMVAREDPLKDHETFLRAARLLADAHPDVHFVLIGPAPDSGLAASTARLGLENRVHLLGLRTDVAELLPGFDLATLTSISEGFPNALGEAMACGLPCVATDVGDVRMLMGESNFVVPPGDAEAIAAGWRTLLELPGDSRIEIGERNRHRIVAEFSIESISGRYLALHLDVAAQRAARQVAA